MHYRNGREAKNFDRIVSLDYDQGRVQAVGTLRDATPGNDYCNDYCNGYIQRGSQPSSDDPVACMCDCLHLDDLAAILKEKGLDKRPAGK